MNKGTCAVALIHGQVVLVQAARTHELRDGYIDVIKYNAFAHGTFVAESSAPGRIASKHLLAILPGPPAEMPSVHVRGASVTPNTLELHGAAYAEFLDLANRNQQSLERKFSVNQRRGKVAFWR